MLVKVNDANEGIQESEQTIPVSIATTTGPATVEEDTGYPFIRKKEERPDRNSDTQNSSQLAIRIEWNGLTAEFFGNNYCTSRNFTVFMDKIGGKHVSSR